VRRAGAIAAIVTSSVAGAAAARQSYKLLRANPPGGRKTWTRTNHRGEPITLLEGPAVVIGGAASALANAAGPREQIALIVAGVGAGGFGAYDDLAGDGGSRGFRGHIGALRNGHLTTGAVKLVGIGANGLVAAALAASKSQSDRSGGDGSRSPVMAAADLVINTGLIAGGANLLNLFDLRPGRAIKVAIGAGGMLTLAGDGGATAAGPLAAAIALLPEDLGERSMLGDAGANALGAMLGVAAASSLSRRSRLAALTVIVGLTAASEVVSFTEVIDQTGPLRWLDMLGRRPVSAEGSAGSQVKGSAPAATAASNGATATDDAPEGQTEAAAESPAPAHDAKAATASDSAEAR